MTSAPPQALEGFLRKIGLTQEQLEERDRVYFAVIERAGRPASEILADTIKRIVNDFPWPKSMRWGAKSASDNAQRWVRPLHGIVAILGEEIVPVEIDGIASGATTIGHRFHHPGDITIGGASDYVEKLRACHVIVDHEERERLIREGAEAIAKKAGLALLPDEGLVVENAGLTEWPVPLVGHFDAEFLNVPREVIVLTMRTNQKYFACTNDEGLLAPAFVCVANIAANDGGEAIAEGNSRVLAARLADARFFWEQDLKIPLEEQAKKLDGIVFHEKLGTVADKVERVAKLARWLVESGVVKADADHVERAARLAKADLVTGMVGEFPELQGVIGGYLAEAQSEPKTVADAIRDHYGAPGAPASAAVALADKVDTICAFFGIDQKPTGSKDPFALRRAAIGSIEIIVSNTMRVSLREAVRGGLANYAAQVRDSGPAHRLDRTTDELIDFFADRLKVQQREAGVRHDLIDAVFALGAEDDLVRLLARVNALQSFVETEDGADLLTAYKRAANILKKEDWGPHKGSIEDLPVAERVLTEAVERTVVQVVSALRQEDFEEAMSNLAALRGPIDGFFEDVLVAHHDPDIRARRLSLLAKFRDTVNAVADFSKIEG
jgi:glycyl-tRNA synthetase beta chain